MFDHVRISSLTSGMAPQKDKCEANDNKCLHELRGALPPVVYNFVCGCKTAKEI